MELFRKLILVILDLPKTIYFNLRTIPIHQAVSLPVRIDYRTKIGKLHKHAVMFETIPSTFMIKIGGRGSKGINPSTSFISIDRKGKIIFKGKAAFAKGNSIRVDSGILTFGNDFSSNHNCFFSCTKSVIFGDNVLLGWNINIRDSDGHQVFLDGEPKENLKEVKIGNHVWITSEVDVLKGTTISDDSVVAYRSCVLGDFEEKNVLIGGYPAKIIQHNINWKA